MTEKTFLGYERPNGYAGARNYVLIMPINRSLNFIASNVAKMTRGTRHFEIPAETGLTDQTDLYFTILSALGLEAKK